MTAPAATPALTPTQVEGILDTQVRPFLRLHGGDIDLLAVSDGGVLELEFQGSCRACALKIVTYAISVRQRLLAVPGITDVNVKGCHIAPAALERVTTAYADTEAWWPQARQQTLAAQPHTHDPRKTQDTTE